MCNSYQEDPTLSKDTNVILARLYCMENRRVLGHCLMKRVDSGEYNVIGVTDGKSIHRNS